MIVASIVDEHIITDTEALHILTEAGAEDSFDPTATYTLATTTRRSAHLFIKGDSFSLAYQDYGKKWCSNSVPSC